MTADTLRRVRGTLLLLSCLIGALVSGDYVGWLSFRADERSFMIIALLVVGTGAVIATDWFDKAHEREQREREEAARREEEASRERRAKLSSAIAKAQELARNEHPNHLDDELLFERGWDDDHIPLYLDPPDIILTFDVLGEEDPVELPLYERDRVLTLERSEYDIRRAIERNVEARRRDELAAYEAERQRKQAEEAEAREIAEREQRLANQQVIDITGKLRDRS